MTLGQKIKKLRIEKGLTQKDLADQLHVTFQTVSKWENDENEPDVSTLRELAKLFGCSLDYLLSENEEMPKEEEPKDEGPKEEQPKPNPYNQRPLHVCEKCKKDIPEDELEIEEVCVHPGGRGRSPSYRQAFYHRDCLEELRKQREEQDKRQRAYKASKAKKLSFGWGIAGGVVALIATLLVLLLVPACQQVVHPALAVLLAILAGYGIFSMLYCIISGSYIGDVFVWCASLSIKMPAVIFSWDLEGFAWLIVMKIVLAVLGFMIGVAALLFAIALSSALGMLSFPFVLIHNNNSNYADAL